EDTLDPFNIEAFDDKKSLPVPHIVPPGKRTIILNPHYYEREYFTRKIIRTYDKCLPRAGFEKPELYFNEDCTIGKFEFLEKYGYIHIYSHGWAWPDEQQLTTIYLMTGEYVNNDSNFTYWRIIMRGEIPLVTIGEKSHKYFVSPGFIAERNDFSEDTTLIYGGFCYSNQGNWPEKILSAGAGGYIGFNWSVQTNYNSFWSRNLVYHLTDTKRVIPMCVKNWFEFAPDIATSYLDNESPFGYLEILYSGYPGLALLPNVILVDLTKANEVQCDIMSTLQWSCPTPNLTFQNIRAPISINSRNYLKEWTYETVFTGGVPVTVSGKIYLGFDTSFSKIDSFFVRCTWHFKGEDKDLEQFGYPALKTQTCSGHNLPIWVNEPDFNRYVYGVQGSMANDYIGNLECIYEYPNGSVCSINKYEFTDETMQMIRFDFRKH
ncbi:MAG: hypothetical protein IH594_00480, partial [Bacteroidales bacterium]|nr:hypothetical protein [Bacteroidales bacterium]